MKIIFTFLVLTIASLFLTRMAFCNSDEKTKEKQSAADRVFKETKYTALLLTMPNDQMKTVLFRTASAILSDYESNSYLGVNSMGGWSRQQVGSFSTISQLMSYGALRSILKTEKWRFALVGFLELSEERQGKAINSFALPYSYCLLSLITNDEAMMEKWPKKDRSFTVKEVVEIQDSIVSSTIGWTQRCAVVAVTSFSQAVLEK